MSDAGLIAIIGASAVAVVGAAASAAFTAAGKRREDDRARNDADRRRTGERIGVLEEWVNFERGRQAGVRENRVRRASDVQ